MAIKFFNNPQAFMNLIQTLLQGTATTLQIFALTLLFSIPLGILTAVGRMSRYRIVRAPISVAIYFLRGTPLMLQLMVVYFLLPMILPISIDRFWAAILAFSVNYAAYFAEIFRGGIQSIALGQREAAQVLGFSRMQTFWRIILPQVFKRVLLPTTNEVMTLIKDTSLAFTISVAELMRAAKTEVSRTTSVEPYLAALLIYLALNGIAEQLCRALEKKMDYYRS